MFIAEGIKTVNELLNAGFIVETLIADKNLPPEVEKAFTGKHALEKADNHEFKKLSALKTPQPLIGVFKLPEHEFDFASIERGLSIVLDNVQDPGNLGTIIRIADWFGIENIICSPNSADAFNPKVVQSTMGAIARVKVFYKDLNKLLKETTNEIYGTHLKGENIYNMPLGNNGFIVFGNESQGISKEVEKLITKKVFVPSFPESKQTIDSLNISVAAGIVCAEFRKRNYSK